MLNARAFFNESRLLSGRDFPDVFYFSLKMFTQECEVPRRILVISNRPISFTQEQTDKVEYVFRSTFRNAVRVRVVDGEIAICEYSVDMLETEKFSIGGDDFLERLGFDASDWKVFLQVI